MRQQIAKSNAPQAIRLPSQTVTLSLWIFVLRRKKAEALNRKSNRVPNARLYVQNLRAFPDGKAEHLLA